MWIWVLAVGAMSTLISGLITGLLVRWTRSASSRWLDQPGTQSHKQHDRAIANVGGIAIFWAIALPWLIALIAAHAAPMPWLHDAGFGAVGQVLAEHLPGMREQSGLAIVVMLAAGVMHALGLIDDRRNLGASSKLIVQLLVCAVLVMLVDLRVLHVLDQFGVAGSAFSVVITVLWMIVLINAMNMLDNMDGLSSGVAVLCAAIFGAVALLAGQWFVAAAAATIAGAALGFWLHNRPPARIFMGDGGSLVLGLMLAVVSIQATYVIWPESASQTSSAAGAVDLDALVQAPGHWHAVLAPVMILAVPLYDFCSVVILRLRQGNSPLKGDRQHLSHRLLERGLSRWAALVVMYLLTVATGLGAITLANLPPTWAIVAGAQTACVLAILAVLEFAGRGASDSHEPRPGSSARHGSQ